MTEENDFTKLGVSGALAQNYAQDAREFMPLLAMFLETAIPNETTVQRKGGLFQKAKPVNKVIVVIQEDTYTLEDPGRGGLLASREKTVRGIRLKTEELGVEEWLHALTEEISKRALCNEKSFFALKELLRL
jgi:hypothetical protein